MALTAFSYQAHAQDPSQQMEEFFGWEDAAQHAHIGNAVVMIAVVATQVAPATARCIDDWYGNHAKIRQTEIREAMNRFRQFTPEAVILAYVEKFCGKLPRAR